MRILSAGRHVSRIMVILCLPALVLYGQATPAWSGAAASHAASQRLRSHMSVYDLRTGSSHEIYTADSIWEAPNWSPDGNYLIANSDGAIYKLKPDGTAKPQKLSIPANYRCNNDKALSPDGTKIAFSATVSPSKGSQVFLADADGTNIKRMTQDVPSYFHGW